MRHRMPRYVLSVLSLVAVLSAGLSQMAEAAPIAVSQTDRGWYQPSGHHNPVNDNYYTKVDAYRSWFVFDLSPITGTITSAQLMLGNPLPYTGGQFNLRSIEGSIADLISGAGGIAAYDDLGDGIIYGSDFLTGTREYKFVSFNSDGLTALNASTGLFAIGGHLTGPPGTSLFGGTGGPTNRTELLLEVSESQDPSPENGVPSPGALVLMSFGLLGIGLRRKADYSILESSE